MLKFLSFVACCAMAFAASSAHAQIANFSDSGHFGVRNLSQHQAGEFAWQANQIENDRFVVTVWPQVAGANVTYFWQTFDKLSGVINGPNLITGANASGAAFDINIPSAIRHLRPGLTFTKAPTGNANAYDGIAIGLTQGVGNSDVFLHFLRVDPMSLPPNGTQPAWIYDLQRVSFNVSNSGGVSDSPSVAALDNGELVVSWRDRSSVGNIGGRALVNPVAPNPNPGFLTAMDVYARRLQQQFDPANPILGVTDGAVQGSTRNLSSSFGQESFPSIVTNGTNTVYAVWQSFSGASDDIAGRGPGSGPIGGAFGAESTDIYGRSITISAANNDLSPNIGLNITSSPGTSNLPPAIAFNRTFNQVAVLFLDNTVNGGIAGNAALKAVPNGPVSSQVDVDDVFLGLYNTVFVQTHALAVTQSPNIDLLVNVASLDAGGWLVGWGESVSATQIDIRSRLRSYDGTGLAQTAPRQYPLQSVVQGGVPQPVWLFAMTAKTPNAINLAFAMAGMPNDLKAGQMAALVGNQDIFLATGVPTSTGVVNGQIQIATFQVNNAQPINPASAPASVDVSILLRNSSGSSSVTLTDLTVQAPIGFTSQGGPNLPVTLPPGGTFNALLTYNVNVSLLQAGQNDFSISTTGMVSGNLTLSSGIGSVSVIGVAGGIAGVQLSITMNPPQIRVGETTSAELTIAVSNGGLQNLTGISFDGDLVQGMIPSSIAGIAFSPIPSQTTVNAGQVVAFRGTVLIGPSLVSQDYRPAFTMNTTQGANAGSVTAQVANLIQIVQGSNGQPAPSPISGLSNSGSGGCALDGAAGAAWLLALLGAAGLVVWQRRGKGLRLRR